MLSKFSSKCKNCLNAQLTLKFFSTPWRLSPKWMDDIGRSSILMDQSRAKRTSWVWGDTCRVDAHFFFQSKSFIVKVKNGPFSFSKPSPEALTLSISGFLTNRKDRRGGRSAPPSYTAIGGYFQYFFLIFTLKIVAMRTFWKVINSGKNPEMLKIRYLEIRLFIQKKACQD